MDSFDTVAGVPEVIARRLSTLETGMLATIVTAQREAASEAVRASGTLELRMDSLEALLCDQYKQMSGLLSHSVRYPTKLKFYFANVRHNRWMATVAL